MVAGLVPLRNWVERTAQDVPGRHINHAALGVPTPPKAPDLTHVAGVLAHA